PPLLNESPGETLHPSARYPCRLAAPNAASTAARRAGSLRGHRGPLRRPRRRATINGAGAASSALVPQAPLAQWIEHWPPEPGAWVRVPQGVPYFERRVVRRRSFYFAGRAGSTAAAGRFRTGGTTDWTCHKTDAAGAGGSWRAATAMAPTAGGTARVPCLAVLPRSS